MDLKYLNTLKAILETGSFQNAAQKLCYTQSTVTFQIQQLEQELSVKLFEKIGRKMVLTQAGVELLPYIDAVLESAARLTSYSLQTREPSGALRVAMAESLLTYRMQPFLKAFREQAPQVRLSLQMQSCYAMRDQVMSGGVDLALHYDVGGYGANVTTEPLATFPLSLIASPDLCAAQRDFTTAHQRKPLCMVGGEHDSLPQILFNRYLQQRDIVFETAMELGSMETIKRSVMSNLGVACLPRFTVEEQLQSGALQELPSPLSAQRITVICAYHKNKWLSPAMVLFLRLLRTYGLAAA